MPRTVADTLRQSDAGVVLDPSATGYEQARRVWNGNVNRHPLAVVRPQSSVQVANLVRATAQAGVPLAVRGGGHGLPGYGTCDAGVVLDLGGMKTIDIAPDRRIATVGGGATWGDLDPASQRHGLATPGGLVSTTGVAGLTLGGGIGWLTRAYGLACDNLMSVELVTASGDVVEASHTSHPELFWALRGGGGNFGVVTSFRFRLHSVTSVYGGLALWPLAAADEVGAAYASWAATIDERHTTMLALLTAPDLPDVPSEMRGRAAIGVIGCHIGPRADAIEQWQGLRSLAPGFDHVGDLDYVEMQKLFDEDLPAGARYYFTGGFADRLNDDLLSVVQERFLRRPSPGCEIDIHHMGGASARVSEADSAYAGRSAAYTFNIIASWQKAPDDEAHIAWGRATREALRDFFLDTTYVNFATENGDASRMYGARRYARLQEVKRIWDPTNLFRLNQNIAP